MKGMAMAMAVAGLVLVIWPNTGVVTVAWLLAAVAGLLGAGMVFVSMKLRGVARDSNPASPNPHRISRELKAVIMQVPIRYARTVGLLLPAVSSVLLPVQSFACLLCIGFPEQTDTDFLMDGHCVILARSSDENPFTYTPRKVLKGTFDGAEINLLVDSMTRRILAANPEKAVVLAQQKAGGEWRNLGIVSSVYLSVVRRILVLGETWRGEDGAQRRWEFFVPLFGHDDPSIRQLAYLELSRQPARIPSSKN